MQRVVLTGAPGCGKTALLHALRDRGYPVVEEAATDVIAAEQRRGIDEPWLDVRFIDLILDLQLERLSQAPTVAGEIQIHDRSLFCTLALATYLGWKPSERLLRAIEHAVREGWYDHRVFFIRQIGAVAPTAARRITYEDALRFERIHEATYLDNGFRLMNIPAMNLDARIDLVTATLATQF